MEHPELLFFFFAISFVYASVGFGGGSSYLAILALYALPFKEVRLIALICNIVVVTGGTILYIRNNQVSWKKVIPLVLLSVPMAFWGASLRMQQHTFYVLLGCSLLVAAVLMWVRRRRSSEDSDIAKDQTSFTSNSFLGGAIGFLSGMLGVGGGIFLSPILNLTRWDTSRKIAATASLFILVNSLAGIAGQLSQLPSSIDYVRIFLLCGAVLVGGQLGSRVAILKFNQLVIRRLTAALIFVAGVEVLYKHLPFFN